MVTLEPMLPSIHSMRPPGVHRGALGDQVVDVVRPVLDGRVADVRVLLDDDLDDAECSESLE
jgi:hypothetical protein